MAAISAVFEQDSYKTKQTRKVSKNLTGLLAPGTLGQLLAVLLAEFIDTTGGVEQDVLTGVERVRLRANLDLHQRVRLSFVLNRVSRLNR